MASEKSYRTTDLCDAHPGAVAVVEPLFRDYGGVRLFHGRIATLKVYEDNVLVRKALEERGDGRVLVIDGGGSLRCALLGDQLAALGHKNGWSGVLVFGCIRDSDAVGRIPLGVKALATNPMKSAKQGTGERDVPVTFGGVTFVPGGFVYADEDGVLRAHQELV